MEGFIQVWFLLLQGGLPPVRRLTNALQLLTSLYLFYWQGHFIAMNIHFNAWCICLIAPRIPRGCSIGCVDSCVFVLGWGGHIQSWRMEGEAASETSCVQIHGVSRFASSDFLGQHFVSQEGPGWSNDGPSGSKGGPGWSLRGLVESDKWVQFVKSLKLHGHV